MSVPRLNLISEIGKAKQAYDQAKLEEEMLELAELVEPQTASGIEISD